MGAPPMERRDTKGSASLRSFSFSLLHAPSLPLEGRKRTAKWKGGSRKEGKGKIGEGKGQYSIPALLLSQFQLRSPGVASQDD